MNVSTFGSTQRLLSQVRLLGQSHPDIILIIGRYDCQVTIQVSSRHRRKREGFPAGTRPGAENGVTVGTKLIGAHWVDQITGDSQTFDGKRTDSDSTIQGKINECQNAMAQHRNPIMNKLQAKLQPLLNVANKFGDIPTPPPLPN